MPSRRSCRLALLLLFLLLPAALPSVAQNDSQLLGDAAGLRSSLARQGVTLQLFSNHYPSWKGRGGASPGDEYGHSGSYDLMAYVDLAELAGLRGLSAFLLAKGQYDQGVNDEVGALSDPIDDADFDEPVYVSAFWAQQELWEGRLRLRAGLFEQQTLFDRNAYANHEDRQFLSSFLDNNGVVPLPSGLGIALLATPLDWLELAAGAIDADNRPRLAGFDTAFDDLESLTRHVEAAVKLRLRSPGGGEELPGSYRVGAFFDGREKEVFGKGRLERGHWGGYLSFDQCVTRETGDSSQGLGLFLRLGAADGDVNRIAWFVSAGLQYTGAIPSRSDDVLGLGGYQAIASSAFREHVDPGFQRETGLELYYRIAVRPWLALTPDLQVILDPGGFGATRSAVLGTLRFRVAF